MFKKSCFLLISLLFLLLVSCQSKVDIYLSYNEKFKVSVNFNNNYTPEDFIKDSGLNKYDGTYAVEGFYLDEKCTIRYNKDNKAPQKLYVKQITGNPTEICLVNFLYQNEKYTLYCKKGEKLNKVDFIMRTYGKEINEELTFKVNGEVINFKDYEIKYTLTIDVSI